MRSSTMILTAVNTRFLFYAGVKASALTEESCSILSARAATAPIPLTCQLRKRGVEREPFSSELYVPVMK
jgi:hypothetical protein